MPLQGICKDCGQGTLNNDIIQAFEFTITDDGYAVVCNTCGSMHVDVVA